MLDAFSGIGGFSLAAKSVGGIQTTQFIEINPFCRSILSRHWHGVPVHEDIRTFDPAGRYWDVATCGFPCQDISWSNTSGRGLDGDRSGLWREMLRVVCQSRPRFVVIENVEALRYRGLTDIIYGLAQSGYVGHYLTVAAAHIGAPHFRERILIVAYPNELLERLRNATPWADQVRPEVEVVFGYQGGRSSKSGNTSLDDGFPIWLDGIYCAGWWKAFPAPPKCGIPRKTYLGRYDELECVGNAVVPGIAAIALSRVLYLNSLL